jgi:hypothetical protein
MGWATSKHASIIQMVDGLRTELGDGAFDVVDHWDDTHAIGIARPDDHGVLAYISTHGPRKDVYWVSLELPAKAGNDHPYEPAGEADVHGIQELATVVRTHFENSPCGSSS